MKLVKRNLTDLVQRDVEKGIRSGIYSAGMPLPSTRALAEKYGVSQRVVILAMDALAKRDLGIRKSAIGNFVNPDAVFEGFKRVAVLYSSPYFEPLLRLSDLSLYPNILLHPVQIPFRRNDKQTLWYELEQIALLQPDCVIFGIPTLSRSDIKRICRHAFPSVFIGDFASGCEIPEINQIVEDTSERIRFFYQVAESLDARKLAIVGVSREKLWCTPFFTEGEKFRRKHGTEIRFYDYSTKGTMELPRTPQENEVLIQTILHDFTPDTLILEGFQDIPSYRRAFEAHGLKIGREINLITFSDIDSGLIYVKADYTQFAEAASQLIKRLLQDPDARFGRQTLTGTIRRTPFRIVDM